MLRRIACMAPLVAGLAFSQPANAIDIMPGDYTVFPSGTGLLMLYGQYSHAGKFKPDGAPSSVPGSDIGVASGVARYVQYFDFNGIPMGVQAILPAGGFTSARIGGADLRRNGGIGDLTVGAAIWPVHSADPTGTTIGLTAYVTTPTGAYSTNRGRRTLALALGRSHHRSA